MYERGDHQAAEEWDHKAQFLKKAFETIGFGILAPKDSELAGNDFGQPSIDHVKMLELLREGKITKEFCDQYLNEQELASILHNALAENIQAIEEKIKLVESFSEHSLKTKHCLEQLQGQLGELEERENNNLLNLSTQKDQIQNSITALEAIVLTPMTKEKLLNFFDAHKNASTYLQESLSFWEAESQENTIQGILKTLKNLHQEYSTSRNQENRCIFILDAAQRIRDVCLRGDVERINAFITPLKKRTEYRSLAAEKKDQGNPEDQGNPATEARYWNDAADACLCEAGELAKDTPNDVLAAAHGQSAQHFVQAAEASAQGNRQEAITWYHAGMMCEKKANELAENSPHEKVAEAYRQEQSAMKTLPRQSPEDVLM